MSESFRNVRAIYFDLDDTLCGYWDAAKAGLRRTFSEHPGHGRPPEEMLSIWGEQFSEFVKEIGSEYWYSRYCESGEHTRLELMRRVLTQIEIEDEELARDLSGTYYVERHAALELFPEAVNCLAGLHPHYPLGLITNGPTDIQRQEIEKLGIAKWFTTILIEGEMGMGKPNPAVMDLAEEKAGAKGQEILMVGNSYKHDMAEAIARGWRTAWIRRPSDVAPSSKTGRPEEKPEEAPAPDLTITSLTELNAVLLES